MKTQQTSTNETLRQLIEHSGLTISQFATRVNVSPETITTWLSDPGSVRYRQLPAMKLIAIKHLFSR